MHEIDAGKLTSVCADNGIPDDETSCLCGIAAQLLHFEKVEKKRLLTDRQRAKDLEKIAGLADDLSKALQRLADDDARSIGAWMPPDGLAVHWQIGIQGQGYTGVIGGPVENGQVSYPAGKGRAGHVANEARALAIGARSFRVDLLPTDSKSGGPRHMLHHYAHYVHEMAEALSPIGLSIGRGGKFQKLCDAVFDAARVPANSEGALRYYLKQVKAGYEWDSLPF